jgi:predicted lipid-binding transport protein (Tim44 family)
VGGAGGGGARTPRIMATTRELTALQPNIFEESSAPNVPSTASSFGGMPGGLGVGGLAPVGALSLGAIGSSISAITDTLKGLIPIAITIIVAVIVIKIVLWLIKRR